MACPLLRKGGHNYGSISLGFRDNNDVLFSVSRMFWPLLWPHGHADRWIRRPASGFLLVLYSNHSSKTHRFWATSMGQTDKGTDTSLLNAPTVVAGGIISLRLIDATSLDGVGKWSAADPARRSAGVARSISQWRRKLCRCASVARLRGRNGDNTVALAYTHVAWPDSLP